MNGAKIKHFFYLLQTNNEKKTAGDEYLTFEREIPAHSATWGGSYTGNHFQKK
jgi:hypothetical protein